MNAEPATTRRRRVLVPAVAGLALALSLSACAAGRDAQTANQKPSQDGVNADVGSIALRGVALQPPSGTSYKAGSNAQLAVVLVNNGSATDRLTAISTSAAGGWSAYPTTAAAAQVAGRRGGQSTSGGTQIGVRPVRRAHAPSASPTPPAASCCWARRPRSTRARSCA